MMGNRWALSGLILLILLAPTWSLSASPLRQGGGALTLTGELTEAQPEVNVMAQVQAGIEVTLTLTSPDFDTVLTVFDSAGGLLVVNDDNDTPLALPRAQDSALALVPEADEIVIVQVSSYSPGETGSYALTLRGAEVLQEAQPDIGSDGVINASGNVIAGALTAITTQATYTFQGFAGTTVTITATSQDFDTVLEVLDESGAQVAINDDNDTSIALPRAQDSAVVLALEADGVFAVVVRSFDQRTGRFTVTIDGAQFGSDAVEVATESETECDNVISGVVVASSVFGGDFEPERLLDSDATTGWSSRGGDETPYLIFDVGYGTPVMLNGVVFNGFSSSPSFVESSVREFEVAVSSEVSADLGTFMTVLRGEAPLESELRTYSFAPVSARYVMLRPLSNYGGSYFEAAEFNACTSLGAGSLGGDPPYVINGFLDVQQPYLTYSLYALDDAELIITLIADGFDPVLEIYGEDGARLADNDSHGPEFDLPRAQDAALSLAVADAGALTVRVRSFAGGGGAFILTIDGTRLLDAPPASAAVQACDDVSSEAVGGAILSFSSEFGGRWRAEYLIDGDELTGWASGPGQSSARTEHVIIDLAGDLQTINGIRINPAATGGDNDSYNVSRFAVLVSDTTSEVESFRQVFATLLESRYDRLLAFEFEPVAARYVMLQTRDSFGGRWHEVAEFTVCAGP